MIASQGSRVVHVLAANRSRQIKDNAQSRTSTDRALLAAEEEVVVEEVVVVVVEDVVQGARHAAVVVQVGDAMMSA